MATEVEIANYALGRVGESPITSLDQASETARTCKLWIGHARRIMLRSANWTSASVRVQINVDADAPAFGFTNRYLKPADFVRLISVKSSARGQDFIEEGRYILTDLPTPLSIKYVFDDGTTAHFSEEMVQVTSLFLASFIAAKLTESNTRERALEAAALVAAREAKGVDVSARAPQNLQSGSWLAARGGVPDPTKWSR